jgi:hypothetical protein
MPLIVIVVYSCLASWPFDDFNPHIINAVADYVAKHPGVCRVEQPVLLNDGVSLSECQTSGPLHYMVDWQKLNPDRTYLGAPCSEHEPDIIMGPIEQQQNANGKPE